MVNEIMTKCPACLGLSSLLLKWSFSGLNDSVFNYTAEYFHCSNCGLVYINNIEDEELARFYQEECLYRESDHFNIHSASNIAKYTHYKNVLEQSGLRDVSLADVGCGRGGFLIWMKQHEWLGESCGVDVDLASMDIGKSSSGNEEVSFRQGSAVALPFEDASQKCLSYFHVFEHIRNLDKLLSEAYRVLDEGGAIMLEVPDALRYADYPLGAGFWMAIREHVYHFTPESLQAACRRNGFHKMNIVRSELPTPEFRYPSLMLVAKKGKGSNAPEQLPVLNSVVDYALQARDELNALAARINRIADEYGTLTFWGCSSVMYSLMPLITAASVRICDISPGKQKSVWNGMKIEDPGCVPAQGALIIGSCLQYDAIEAAALVLGWDKKSIFGLG